MDMAISLVCPWVSSEWHNLTPFRYSPLLARSQEMGFSDPAVNILALNESGQSVTAAIELLFSDGSRLAEKAKTATAVLPSPPTAKRYRGLH